MTITIRLEHSLCSNSRHFMCGTRTKVNRSAATPDGSRFQAIAVFLEGLARATLPCLRSYYFGQGVGRSGTASPVRAHVRRLFFRPFFSQKNLPKKKKNTDSIFLKILFFNPFSSKLNNSFEII